MNMQSAMQENAMRVFDQKTRRVARDAMSGPFPLARSRTLLNQDVPLREATSFAVHDPQREARVARLATDLKTLKVPTT